MSRYIDADEALEQIRKKLGIKSLDYLLEAERQIVDAIQSAPSIDIVFCKECKHRTYCYSEVHMTNKRQSVNMHKDIDFCSYGEREGE